MQILLRPPTSRRPGLSRYPTTPDASLFEAGSLKQSQSVCLELAAIPLPQHLSPESARITGKETPSSVERILAIKAQSVQEAILASQPGFFFLIAHAFGFGQPIPELNR